MSNIEKIKCDVIIVGGGPAGATAARELAKRGIDIILLEKNLSFKKPCGGGIMLSAYDEFDLPKELIEKRVNQIDVVSPSLNRVSVDISDTPLTVVDRVKFDAKLRELAAQSGARVIEAKAHDINTANGVRVVAKSKSKQYDIEARYLIAADGVNSSTRKKLLGEAPSRVLTHYIDIADADTNACQFWFGDDISPGYYSWIFPHHQGVNIGLVSDTGKMQEHMSRLLEKSQLQTTTKAKGYYIPHWGKEVFFEKSTFFIGDSASMVLPFTYEGIYYAMQSGTLAAQAIADDDPESYERAWRAKNEKRFRFMRLLQKIFLSSDFMSEKMVKLYEKPSFQKSVIGYWIGSREPKGLWGTLWKVIKLIFRRR